MVQDGEIDELAAGDLLCGVALRASCWSIREARDADGVHELTGADPAGELTPHYALTGTAGWGRPPSSTVLLVGNVEVLAEPNRFREVPGLEPGGPEPYSPDFMVPPVGARVTVVARIEVMADYEADGFAFPDLRRNWVVRQVKLERRSLVKAGAREMRRGPITSVERIDRMQRWADEGEGQHVSYLIDLQLAASN